MEEKRSLFLEAGFFQIFLEAGVGADVVHERIDVELDHRRNPILVGFFQPSEGLIFFA